MPDRLTAFLETLKGDVYPEPISGAHSRITEQMAAEIAKLVPAGASILDVGCGRGPALDWFSAHGFRAIGTSLCAEDIEICRAKGRYVTACDMHDMPFAHGSMDCVWARHVLEHSPIPLLALMELRRVLKPTGVLYVEVPMADTSAHHETNPNHYSLMSPSMWANLIQRAGFALINGGSIALELECGPDEYHCFIALRN